MAALAAGVATLRRCKGPTKEGATQEREFGFRESSQRLEFACRAPVACRREGRTDVGPGAQGMQFGKSHGLPEHCARRRQEGTDQFREEDWGVGGTSGGSIFADRFSVGGESALSMGNLAELRAATRKAWGRFRDSFGVYHCPIDGRRVRLRPDALSNAASFRLYV